MQIVIRNPKDIESVALENIKIHGRFVGSYYEGVYSDEWKSDKEVWVELCSGDKEKKIILTVLTPSKDDKMYQLVIENIYKKLESQAALNALFINPATFTEEIDFSEQDMETIKNSSKDHLIEKCKRGMLYIGSDRISYLENKFEEDLKKKNDGIFEHEGFMSEGKNELTKEIMEKYTKNMMDYTEKYLVKDFIDKIFFEDMVKSVFTEACVLLTNRDGNMRIDFGQWRWVYVPD